MTFCALSFTGVINAQVTCQGVNVSAYPKRVQSGSYDYYGVQVTLTQPYSQNITVVGTITEQGVQNVVNMFTLTVTAGSLMARTSETFYSVPHGRSVVVTVESIDPCPQSNTLTPEVLAADTDFIQLLQLTNSSFEGYDSVIINTPEESYENYSQQIEFYTSQSQLNDTQVHDLANLMGFSDVSAFADYVNTSTELISRIRNRYPAFQTGNVEDLQATIKSAFDISAPDGLCEDIYKNCKSTAHAVYTGEVLVCTGTAIGVGAATFGLGGVLFQAACGAVAIYHYNTMMKGCYLDYQRCK